MHPENVQDTQNKYHELMHHNPHVTAMVRAGYSERAIILHLCRLLEEQFKLLMEAECRRPPPAIHVTVSQERMDQIDKEHKDYEAKRKDQDARTTDS